MRKVLVLSFLALLSSSGCSDRQMMGTYLGGTMGGMLGSSIGGLTGGPRGSDAGTLIGMLAGGALGSALTAPRSEDGQGSTGGSKAGDDEVYSLRDRDVDEYNRRTPASSRQVGEIEIEGLRFIDHNRDGCIERGERCELVFTLYNRGSRTLYDLTPVIVSDNRRIRFSTPATIASLRPGKGVRYSSVVYADRRLKDGRVACSIRVMQGQREVELCTFSIPARR